MSIAMLTNNYKPFVGGVPISIERLSEGLRNLGHEVYVFAPSYENQAEEPYVIRYRSRKKRLRDFIVPDMFDSIIKKKFEEIPFDLIHVHHPMLMGYVAHYLGRKYDIPVVYTYHTRYEQYLHYFKVYQMLQKHAHKTKFSPVYKLEDLILESCESLILPAHNRIFMNQCDLIFAPTQSIKRYLESLGVLTNIEILPTGIAEENFTFDQEKKAMIRHTYLGDKKFLFCTVSRLELEKNLAFILEGLELLKERVGDCFRMLIIGDGSQKEELVAMAQEKGLEENVVFCGSISHKEISNYYHACDLFLFASQSETQGIVLLEAMAAGLPVVAVSASGVNDVVQHGINGFRTTLDARQWSDRVACLIENDELRKKMREKALQVAKGYHVNSIAYLAQTYYQNLYQGLRHNHYEEQII